ncbi:MAG: YdeI/OmpD-associated family protein [Verrucomicrobia bacterium]|nr:YdeI/OmpD-associated family protein [Verrucomicrobiota bacterium]
MPSPTDPRVDAYIAKAAPFAQPILRHLRKLVHQACPEVAEDIKWGMPSFIYAGKILCGTAAFKQHATFGFWHQEMAKIIQQDRGTVEGAMGLLGRITSLADLPADKQLLAYIKKAAALTASGQPARVRSVKPKPALPVPADLAAALKGNKKAAATWATFPPGCRREYLEWVTEAKRPATRATRVATTLEWLAAGKRRNWKYENC